MTKASASLHKVPLFFVSDEEPQLLWISSISPCMYVCLSVVDVSQIAQNYAIEPCSIPVWTSGFQMGSGASRIVKL